MIREGEKQLPNLWSSVMYFVCMHVNVGVHFPLSIYSQLHFTVVSAQMHHQSNPSRAEVRGIVGRGTQLTSKITLLAVVLLRLQSRERHAQ